MWKCENVRTCLRAGADAVGHSYGADEAMAQASGRQVWNGGPELKH